MGMTHSMAYIKVDGKLLPTMPGAKLGLGGKKREPVVGGNRMLGYSEKIEPSTLECEISLSQGMTLAELQGITAATVTYDADTGQSYLVRNAFVTDTLSVTAGEGGKVALKFAGDPAEELKL